MNMMMKLSLRCIVSKEDEVRHFIAKKFKEFLLMYHISNTEDIIYVQQINEMVLGQCLLNIQIWKKILSFFGPISVGLDSACIHSTRFYNLVFFPILLTHCDLQLTSVV